MSWWLLDWYNSGGAALVVSWVFWVFFSIVMHELSHGWAAIWQGDDTPRALGHMTWNPLVHMPPMSILMFIIIGITWGLMPVDPSKFKWKRQGRIVVAAAGPAMNILLFIVAMTGLLLWERLGGKLATDPDVFMNFHAFFYSGAMLNLVLALFNLLPLPPLDGAEILSGMSLKWYIWMQDPRATSVGFFILLVLFLTPAGEAFWQIAIAAIIAVRTLVESIVGLPGP